MTVYHIAEFAVKSQKIFSSHMWLKLRNKNMWPWGRIQNPWWQHVTGKWWCAQAGYANTSKSKLGTTLATNEADNNDAWDLLWSTGEKKKKSLWSEFFLALAIFLDFCC